MLKIYVLMSCLDEWVEQPQNMASERPHYTPTQMPDRNML